jgi:hypothetical protein
MIFAPTQSTGRVSTSAENRILLANLLAMGRFPVTPRIEVAALKEVMTYAPW